MSLVADFEHLYLNDFFMDRVYHNKPEIIKSSKGKDAVLYLGYYYNHLRDNKKSTVFKCREVLDDKECPGSITISDNGQFIAKSHHEKHKAMESIESDIRKMTRWCFA